MAVTVTLYTRGRDVLHDWQSGTFGALLLQGGIYTPDPDDEFVADVTAGGAEVALTGYARDTITGATRAADDATNEMVYDCDNLDFGSIIAGDDITTMVVFEDAGSDAARILVAAFQYTGDDVIPTDGNPQIFVVSTRGLFRNRQGS